MNSLVELLKRAAEGWPERGFHYLSDKAQTVFLSYSELLAQATRRAAVLEDLEPGSRVLLLCGSGLDFIVDFWSCLLAGMVAVPAPAPHPARRRRTLSRLQKIVEDCRPARVLGGDWALLPRHSAADAPRARAEGLAVIQYTSGSTRDPRGVMLSHQNLDHNLAMLAEFLGHPQSMVMVHWLPLYHDMGLIRCMLSPIHLGGDCYFMEPMDFVQRPRRWLEAMSEYRATVTGAPNFGFELAMKKGGSPEGLDLSQLEVAFCTSEPIRAQTLAGFSRHFQRCGFRASALKPAYGLAEATVMVSGELGPDYSVRRLDEKAFRRGRVMEAGPGASAVEVVACGTPLGGQRVVAVDDRGRVCAQERIGEIWIQGPSVATGYWGRPHEETFAGYLDNGDGPFLRTGDLGFLDARGRLYLTGRLKDLLIFGGLNYYPQDLEAAVDELQEVRSGATVAFSTGGKLLIACEVKGSPDWQELVVRIRAAVSEEFGLSVWGVIFLAPGTALKTASGKVQRSLTRRSYLEGTLDTLHSWNRPNPGEGG